MVSLSNENSNIRLTAVYDTQGQTVSVSMDASKYELLKLKIGEVYKWNVNLL